MAERKVRSYTMQDKREIVSLLRDPEALAFFPKATRKLEQFADKFPTEPFDTFSESFPAVDALQGKGKGLLIGVHERFQEAHAVTTHWKDRMRANRKQTREAIKTQLHIPDNQTIQKVRFLKDCGIVFLSPEDVDEVYRHHAEASGVKLPDHYGIAGFVSPNLFLEDDEGNQCGMMVVDHNWMPLIVHERQHIVFQQYVMREGYTPLESKQQSLTDMTTHMTQHGLDNFSSFPEKYEFIKHMTSLFLSEQRVLFLNEIIAEAAGSKVLSQTPQFRRIADNVNPLPPGRVHPSHSYGTTLSQSLDGIVKGIIRAQMTHTEQLALWTHVEHHVASFSLKNEVIARTVEGYYDKTRNKNDVVHRLQSVPIQRTEVLLDLLKGNGNFTENERNTLKKNMQRRVLEGMLVRSARLFVLTDLPEQKPEDTYRTLLGHFTDLLNTLSSIGIVFPDAVEITLPVAYKLAFKEKQNQS